MTNTTAGMPGLGRTGLLALGAVTASALAAAAMGSVPAAQATCASFFGLGSGGQCTSTLTSIAVAIGENAEAHAGGLLGAALTFGDSSSATTVAGALANFAVTFGSNNLTSAGGIGSVAFVANSINQSVIAGEGDWTSGNIANVAGSFAGPEATEVSSTGIGNISVNLAGSGSIAGDGVGLTTLNVVGLNANLSNAATLNGIANISGNNISIANLGGIANLGFNFIGEDNVVTSDGALAVAGTVASVGQSVNQSGPGVNISFAKGLATPAAARGAAVPASASESVSESESVSVSESKAAAAEDPGPATGFEAKSVRKARAANSHADRGGR